MMLASDAKAIADKVNAMRLCVQEDIYQISERVFEASKKGLYEIEYDVFYDDSMLVDNLIEDIRHYGFVSDYAQKYTKEKGIYFTVVVKWADDSNM